MNMLDCAHFEACSAPICPLDREWRTRPHLKGEPSCLYLREYAKPTSRANLKTVLAGNHYFRVVEVYDSIMTSRDGAGLAELRHTLKQASKRKSKVLDTHLRGIPA